jgi:hypothetical protein
MPHQLSYSREDLRNELLRLVGYSACKDVSRNVYVGRVLRLLVTANVPSSPIPVTLMMEAPNSSETSVLTRATRRNIPEDGILHSHRRENLKSYIALTGWTL